MLTKALINESVFLSVRDGAELNDYLCLVLKYVIISPLLIILMIMDIVISPLEVIAYILSKKGTAK